MTNQTADGMARLHAKREALRAELAAIDAELGEAGEGDVAQLAAVLDRIEIGIWSISARTGRLLVANEALVRMSGRPREAFAVEKASLIPWLHPDDQASARTVRQLVLEGKERDYGHDWRVLRPGGEERWWRIRSHAVADASGAIERVDALIIDVTEQRRAEEAARKAVADEVARVRAELEQRVTEATQSLQEANTRLLHAARAKDAFLANMSHELRTPLNAVLGLSEALQEEVYGPLVDKQRTALQGIEKSGRHLLSLIGDILDLSKIEAGKADLEITDVAVGEACRASLAMIEGAAQQKGIAVSLQVTDGFAVLKADERKLKQILVNLLTNAVKFTPQGGSAGLDVHVDRADETVRFTVWDTGIGIAADDLPRLFQPFVQLETGLARTHAGSGLGLALVRSLVDLHGGSISVESELGKGSRFSVRMPLRRKVESSAPRGGPRALIVEDSAPMAEQLARYLREVGVDSVVHDRATGAVQRAIDEQPSVILLDILLPAEVGWQVLRELKAEPRTSHIPVIVVSVLDRRGQALSLGAADFVNKPVDRDVLHAAVARATGGRERERPVLIVGAQHVEEPPSKERAWRILVADDDESNVLTVLDFLRSKDCEVFVARDGREAVELAGELRPDAILMDIQMPVMDGLAAIQAIRSDGRPELQRVPIIALTALAMAGDRERCLEAGANEYLAKPVSLKRLTAAMAALLPRPCRDP